MQTRGVREWALVIRSFIHSARPSFTNIRCVPGPELGAGEQELHHTLGPAMQRAPRAAPRCGRLAAPSQQAGLGRLACVNVPRTHTQPVTLVGAVPSLGTRHWSGTNPTSLPASHDHARTSVNSPACTLSVSALGSVQSQCYPVNGALSLGPGLDLPPPLPAHAGLVTYGPQGALQGWGGPSETQQARSTAQHPFFTELLREAPGDDAGQGGKRCLPPSLLLEPGSLPTPTAPRGQGRVCVPPTTPAPCVRVRAQPCTDHLLGHGHDDSSQPHA